METPEKQVLKAELRMLSKLQQRLSDWKSSVNEQIRLKQEQYRKL